MRHKVLQGLAELEMIGEDVLITDGYRTLEEQKIIFAQGRTTPGAIVSNSPAGWSYHNYSLAIDIVPVGPLGVELSRRNLLEWSALSRYATIGRVMQGAGLEWGFQLWGVDRPHFQIAGTTIQDIRAGWKPNIAQARNERKDALKGRIAIAKEALYKSYTKPSRKRALERFIKNKTQELERILL